MSVILQHRIHNMLTSKIEYWQAKENTNTQGRILTSKGGLKSKGKWWQAKEDWNPRENTDKHMRIDTQLKSGNSDSRRPGCIPERWGDWLQAGPSKKTAENAKCRPKGGNSSRGGKWRPEGEMQLHLTWGSGSCHLATTWWIMSNCNYSKKYKMWNRGREICRPLHWRRIACRPQKVIGMV